MSDFTNRIDSILTQNKKRRADLARGTGIPESTMRGWIRGTIPNIDYAVKIAEYLNVSLDWLLTGNEQTLSPTKILASDEEELLNIYRTIDNRDKLDLLDIARAKRSHYSNSMKKDTSIG